MPVPSRREAIEALGIIQRLTQTHDDAALVNRELISWTQCMDTLRRFILTR
jgi:hypothetical protein